MNDNEFLTIEEVATLLGVCRQRISRKLKQGHFPGHKKCRCGISTLIPASDLTYVPEDRRKRHPRK